MSKQEAGHPSTSRAWIEAMRLRTLPVSVAGVLAGTACALMSDGFSFAPFLICLLFAVIAQIASNFANEYYDWRNGLDSRGREGFRRGVTEGDISPRAMRNATYALLAIDSLLGCSLIYWGGWWLVPVGIAIALFALGYSTGPYPLSHHGLGDIAVIIFFGIVPVIFTAYLQTGTFDTLTQTLAVGLAVGMLADEVLIVNNYRDMEADAAVGKHTTAVIFGRRVMSNVYLCFAILALVILCCVTTRLSPWWAAGWATLAILYYNVWRRLKRTTGAALNAILRLSAVMMLACCVLMLAAAILK